MPRAQYARISTVASPLRSSTAARHRDRVRLHERPALVVPDALERAGQPAEHHHAERRLVLPQRRDGLLQQLDGAAGRRMQAASTCSRSRRRRARTARGRRAPAPCPLRLGTPSRQSSDCTGAVLRRSELELHLRALAPVGDAELERRPKAAPQPRRMPGRTARALAARTLYSTARSTPPTARALARNGARGRRGTGPARRRGRATIASPTRRWSSARRSPPSRSYSARRTSSCVKRNASRGAGHLLDHPAAHRLLERRRESAVSKRVLPASRSRARSRSPRRPPARAARRSGAARRESRWLTTSRTLSGRSELGQRTGKPGSPLRRAPARRSR